MAGLPASWVRRLRRAAAPVRPMLYRTAPLSRLWGHERGTPIDRVYIERFLDAHRTDIRGRVLEIRDRDYTVRFGSGVTRSDVLDIDPANPAATIVADLTTAGGVAAASWDCVILTQTLQYVTDPGAVIGHLHRMLAPGGVLLMTVPGIIRVDPENPGEDRWRWTEPSCRELLDEHFGAASVVTFGNVLSATAFLWGLAAEELAPARMSVTDPAFPVVIAARAVRERAHR